MVLTGILAAFFVAGALWVWSLFHKPALPNATCGMVWIQPYPSGTVYKESDVGALACFQEAAASCRDAGLLIRYQGTDTGTDDVIVLHRDHTTCSTRLSERSWGIGRMSPILQFACDQVQVDHSGETVTCGYGGKFSIPRQAGG